MSVNVLEQAIKQLDAVAVEQFLNNHSVNINHVSNEDESINFNPLLLLLNLKKTYFSRDDYFVEQNCKKALNVIKILVAHGADVNYNFNNTTPFTRCIYLLYKVCDEFYNIFLFFIQHGGNPKVTFKFSPLLCFLSSSADWLCSEELNYIHHQNLQKLSWEILKSMVVHGFCMEDLSHRDFDDVNALKPFTASLPSMFLMYCLSYKNLIYLV